MLRREIGDWKKTVSVDRRRSRVSWAEGIVLEGGRPFTLVGHEWQRDILEDDHPNQVWCKGAQGGWTTLAMFLTLHDCLYERGFRAAMYFFPSDRDVSDFSQARFGPLLRANPNLARQMQDLPSRGTADRITLKRIGGAHLYFRGMNEATAQGQERSGKLLSVPADRLVFDELDRMEPGKVVLALERLASSTYRRVVRLSNPSLPGYGIDQAYQESDRRRWLIRCSACRAFNCPERDFPEKPGLDIRIIRSTREGTYFLACRSCGQRLDPASGRWVAEDPTQKDCRGYSFSQLTSPLCDLKSVVERYRKGRFLAVLYNMVVGRAWVAAEDKLDRHQVLDLCGMDGMLTQAPPRCTMGVDVGRDLYVVVSRPHPRRPGVRQLIHLNILTEPNESQGAVPFGELDPLMRRFNVVRCVIDGGPYQHAARKFAARFPGKVFLSFFNEHQRGAVAWDPERCMVQINRTEILDASHEAVRSRRIELPHEQPIVQTFADHLAADAKQLEEDPQTGSRRHTYVKLAENHFDFAYTYDFMAWMDEPQRPAARILAYRRGDGTIVEPRYSSFPRRPYGS
jgi:hypothetical protein